MPRPRTLLFFALLLTTLITYFTRTSLHSVDTIRSESYADPLQTPVTQTNLITFTRDGYRYQCTPLFDYAISGLVVRKLDYSWFSIDRSEKAFPVDLCIIWGENLEKKYHQNQTVKFSQDCRFCFAQWGADVPFRMDQLSNNHLLVSDPAVEKKLKSILTGDQVTIHGRLVNVKGQLISEGGQYDSESIAWNSSTIRTDTGGGACEVIYVDNATILESANSLSRWLFKGSLCILTLMILWTIVDLFRPLTRAPL